MRQVLRPGNRKKHIKALFHFFEKDGLMTIYLYIFQVFEQGGTVTTVSNFPSFERSLNEFFPGQVISIKKFLAISQGTFIFIFK